VLVTAKKAPLPLPPPGTNGGMPGAQHSGLFMAHGFREWKPNT